MHAQLRNMQAEWIAATGYHIILRYDPAGFMNWSTNAVYGLHFPHEDRTLLSQLANAAGSYYRWDRQGELVRLRSKTWFLDRPREIPLRLVRGWQASFARYGELTLNQYAAAAATLTDLQLLSTERLIRRGVLPSDALLNNAAVAPAEAVGKQRVAERDWFVWVQFHLTERPRLRQDIYVYYTAPAS